MKILITGGAGFIGSNLSKFLLNKGHKITIVDDFSSGKHLNIEGLDLTVLENRVEDLEVNRFEKIDCILHLAAQASVPLSIDNFYQSSANNFLSSLKVFEIAKKFSLPVVYASSSAVYGNLPIGDDRSDNIDILSPYALDKLTVEHYAQLFKDLFSISSIGFRFFNVYGPNQDPNSPYSGVIPLFISNSIRGDDLDVFGGEQTRDFIHVRDVCEIIEISLDKVMNLKKPQSEILNLGTGKSISIMDLALKINHLVKSDSLLNTLPPVKGDPERSDGNYKKLLKSLEIEDYKFIDLNEGLLEVIEWVKDNI